MLEPLAGFESAQTGTFNSFAASTIVKNDVLAMRTSSSL